MMSSSVQSPSQKGRFALSGRGASLSKHRQDHTRQLFAQYQTEGVLEARDQIVEAHLDLVRRLCRRFAHTPEPQEDLVQVGCVGLLKAIEKFDLERGTGFVAFAIPEILGEVLNYFRDHGWAVKLPRKLQANKVLVARTSESLAQSWGRWPTVPELAAATTLTEEQVLEAMVAERNGTALSLDGEPEGEEGESAAPLMDSLGAPDPEFEACSRRILLEGPLAALDERERNIVYLSFHGDKTQTEIAHQLGISQMHVSRLLRRAIAKLRASLTATSVPQTNNQLSQEP